MADNTFTINIPIPPANIRGKSSLHPKIRGIKRNQYGVWAAHLRVALMDHGVTIPVTRMRLTWHFKNPAGDIDNFAYGMKGFTDGCVKMGNVADDDADHVTYGEHTFTKFKRCQQPSVDVEALVYTD